MKKDRQIDIVYARMQNIQRLYLIGLSMYFVRLYPVLKVLPTKSQEDDHKNFGFEANLPHHCELGQFTSIGTVGNSYSRLFSVFRCVSHAFASPVPHIVIKF